MTLEWTQHITYLIIDFFAILTFIFSLNFLSKIYGKKEQDGIKKLFFGSFLMISLGYLFYATAEISWSILSFLGRDPAVGFADILWIIGIFLLFFGFSYLAILTYKEQGNFKKFLWIFGAGMIFSGAILFYLINNFIFGAQQGESLIEIFLDYLYPISSAFIFIPSLYLYFSFEEMGAMGKAMFFLVLSNFGSFVGDMLYTYYSWNEIFGVVGVISEIGYIFQYVFAFIAFFMLSKIIK